MELLVIARMNGLQPDTVRLREWLNDLSSSNDGECVVRNLQLEVALPLSSAGRDSVCELVRRIEQWPSQQGSAIIWLHRLLETAPDMFLCRGRSIVGEISADAVCHVKSVESVRDHLLRQDLQGDEGIFGQAGDLIGDHTHYDDWLRDIMNSPDLLRGMIDQGKNVRGRLPVVFCTPESDRTTVWPKGTTVQVLLQLFGLLGPTAHSYDAFLLFFSRQNVSRDQGSGHVPSAFDAFSHPYFQPPNADDEWGWTWDLRSPSAQNKRGVREVVVRSFPAKFIRKIEVLRV